MEQWKTVLEAPRYEVSDRGRIRNKETQRILKAVDNGHGVPRVNLRDAGFTISRSVPALVKKAFT